jgi:hypothetical protein
MSTQTIKKGISSLKNKLFSFFKIKKNKNIRSNSVTDKEITDKEITDKEITINKKINNYTIMNMESSIENIDVSVYKSVDKSVDMDTGMIHSLFVLNDIIDKIVTNTFGSCDNKTYVKNISEFYINNEDYPLYRNIFPHGIYLEFSIYIQALLTKNISIIYNLRSVKLYDNDMVFCSCRAGVFKTDNFIIKIDTDSFNFKNEITCMYNIDKGLIKKYNIVLPYYSKINCKNKRTINFSIQPRIHNTISLRDWLLVYENQNLDVEFYLKLCIQICKSIQFIHSKHIVHGDIKPDNILMELKTNTPYIIDFGLSGLHGLSEGTGGTKPYCHPSTMNIDDNPSITEYNWVKNEKKNDVWSVSFIFACILIFRKCYTNYNNFPSDFFDENKYVNINYLNYIPKQYRTAFILSLSKNDNSCNNDDTTLDIQSFILLLERGLNL